MPLTSGYIRMLVGDVFDFGNDAIQPAYVYKFRHSNTLYKVGESIYKFTRKAGSPPSDTTSPTELTTTTTI